MSMVDDIAKVLEQPLALAAGDAKKVAQALIGKLEGDVSKSPTAIGNAIFSCLAKLRVGAPGQIISAMQSGNTAAALDAGKGLVPAITKAAVGLWRLLKR